MSQNDNVEWNDAANPSVERESDVIQFHRKAKEINKAFIPE